MIGQLADLIGMVFVLSGALFAIVGAIGLLRLPDFYSRIHGAGITDTLGAGLVLTGLMLYAGPSLAAVKLVMILLFLWITGPTATHALAKAALASGLTPRLAEDSPGPEGEEVTG
ncbi:MAG: monovalent cation/H(+) antiporter subunit G [Gemmatimonadota bacterium]|nr:monovalent cation/H(+) antiporter subunit G [Gemmatimonadota bacterium]